MIDILVVEDDLVSGKLIQKILTKKGYAPIFVENGFEAWEILNSRPIRMVITDWIMPGMDGPTLCRKIRESSIKHYIYIILLTAKMLSSDAVAGLEAGADDFISKPIEPEELMARLRAGYRIIQLEEDQKKAHFQLLQTEKMASIGQLAAGVAHEINNPTGFVSSNLKTLTDYTRDLYKLCDMHDLLLKEIEDTGSAVPSTIRDHVSRIRQFQTDIDLEYIKDDIVDLVDDCREGAERIKKIVIDLKDFAHPGSDKLKPADINMGIESTLNVIANEIKYKAKVHKEFGQLPMVYCYPQQLNQVFLNIIVNAAQAIETQGDIRITTRYVNRHVEVDISDTGSGIPQGQLTKIFDPFYTTKEVGKGTGLGMNVAYNIIQKHHGRIHVESEPGKGTMFRVIIPALEEPPVEVSTGD